VLTPAKGTNDDGGGKRRRKREREKKNKRKRKKENSHILCFWPCVLGVGRKEKKKKKTRLCHLHRRPSRAIPPKEIRGGKKGKKEKSCSLLLFAGDEGKWKKKKGCTSNTTPLLNPHAPVVDKEAEGKGREGGGKEKGQPSPLPHFLLPASSISSARGGGG